MSAKAVAGICGALVALAVGASSVSAAKRPAAGPVRVSLVKGRNVLCFSRNDPVKGLTMKDFILMPVQ